MPPELRGVAYRPDPLGELPRQGRRDRAGFVLSVLFATGLHIGIALALPRAARTAIVPPELTTEVIDITHPEPSPAPPPPLPLARAKPPPLAAASPPPRAAPAPPPPATAQAGRVMARAADENEPLDFTTGSAQIYSGGSTKRAASATGRGARSVAGSSASKRRGSARVSTGDASRRASIAGGLDWSCPFPHRADVDGVDYAVVTLSIAVSAEGRGHRATVLQDPGHGFGRAAKRCALAKRYAPALDRAGRPLADTLVVNVRFVR